VSSPEIAILKARRDVFPRLWPILESVIREGLTYPLPRDMSAAEAADYWFAPGNHVFAAEADRAIIGSYYLRANQRGGGEHVANAGFMTAPGARGRGVARTMAMHALAKAAELGFEAMQFNFVISTNARAVGLWHSLGFTTVGVLPEAFEQPDGKRVDVFVMFRKLSPPPALP